VKAPASAPCNRLKGSYDIAPDQLDLELPVPDEAVPPDDNTVMLLATESGAQLLVAGFGLYIGKKGDRRPGPPRPDCLHYDARGSKQARRLLVAFTLKDSSGGYGADIHNPLKTPVKRRRKFPGCGLRHPQVRGYG